MLNQHLRQTTKSQVTDGEGKFLSLTIPSISHVRTKRVSSEEKKLGNIRFEDSKDLGNRSS